MLGLRASSGSFLGFHALGQKYAKRLNKILACERQNIAIKIYSVGILRDLKTQVPFAFSWSTQCGKQRCNYIFYH